MNSTDHERQENSDELFESLFKNAATRKRPSDGDEARVQAALRQEWIQLTDRSRRVRRFTVGFAAAASVVLAIALYTGVFEQSPGQAPVSMVASVVKHSGRVLRSTIPDQGPTQVVRVGDTLVSGTLITTAHDARLAIRWAGGESIRLDNNTRVRLLSDTDITLLSGRIYIDSDAEGRSARDNNGPGYGLGINTPFGRVQHIGTRYMTSLADNGVIVSVREGRVSVTHGSEESRASKGQQLSLSNLGEIKLEPIAVYGEKWQWIEELAPGFVLDGRSMADFLGWVSRESGQSLEYGSIAAESLAHDTIMHGKVDLEPLPALRLMLQTSDLVATTQNGVIRIDAN